MAVAVNINTITSGYNLSKINANDQNIKNALSDALSRSGNGPNQMTADIDLNDNDLLNVNTGEFETITIGGVTLTTDVIGQGPQGIKGDKGDTGATGAQGPAGAGSGDMLKSAYDAANINQQVVGTTAIQTLTNKTLTSPTINGGSLSSSVTGTTQSVGDNSTKLATTAFVIANAVTATPAEVLLASAIGTQNVSSLDIDFTSALSTYRGLRIVLYNLQPTTDIVTLQMLTSTNSGSSFDTGGGDYGWVLNSTFSANSGSTNNQALAAYSDSKVLLATTAGITNSGFNSITLEMTTYKTAHSDFSTFGWKAWGQESGSSQSFDTWNGASRRFSTTQANAVRFKFSGGNIQYVSYALYGIN